MDESKNFKLLKTRYYPSVSDITLLKQFHRRYGNDSVVELLKSYELMDFTEKILERLPFDFKSHGDINNITSKQFSDLVGWKEKGSNIIYINIADGEIRHTMGNQSRAKLPHTSEYLLIYTSNSCLTNKKINWDLVKKYIIRFEFVEPKRENVLMSIMTNLKIKTYSEKMDNLEISLEQAVVLVGDIIKRAPVEDCRWIIPYDGMTERVVNRLTRECTVINGWKISYGEEKESKNDESVLSCKHLVNLNSLRPVYTNIMRSLNHMSNDVIERMYKNHHMITPLFTLLRQVLNTSNGYIMYKYIDVEFVVNINQFFNLVEILNAFPYKEVECSVVVGRTHPDKNLSDYYYLFRQSIEINNNCNNNSLDPLQFM